MTKTIGLKHRLLAGVLALVMALTAFIGTTFAWFTDSVTSGSNIIQSGSLQVEMHWSDTLLSADSTEWKNAEGVPIFTYDNWEPNYTEVKYIKISNVGNLALKWRLSLAAESEMTKLADVIDVYYINPVTETVTSLEGKTSVGLLTNVINTHKHTDGVLLPAGEQSTAYTVGEVILAVAFHMHKDAGNEYKNLTVGDGFSVDLVATQFDYENDVFGNDYDVNAPFPDMKDVDVIIEVPVENGAVKTTTTVSGEGYTATVLEGTKVTAADGKLGLTVTEKEKSESNVNVGADEVLRPLDVHVEGVAADNTKPIIVNLGKVMAPGMNMGNYTLYHVENSTANAMTLVSAPAELDAHNEFYYNPVTGEVTVAMATFSEVALVADTVNAWEGKFDYTWYDASKTELTIANADQLAAFGAIVGGMAKKDGAGKIYTSTGVDESATVVQDSFNGKTVKLLADINLGDKESENNESFIFHPIGYWNNEEMYERKPVEERQEAVQSGFYAFEGTFDGNGNTIANFYHNTWEIKGDHNWYSAVTEQYFRDGMGLFGKVYGGTVKNLTVDNFSSDGEITTTGVIAAYADSKAGQPAVFENIAITHCNPRVYNIGNGGIVGCAGWYSKDDDLGNADYTNAVVFRNITVDQTNKISALWGTYDVSCGGILGQYYPDSGCGIKLENCHVSAIIDVNNDVCANYQYYWYRYSGMFIGTIRANTKDDAGYTVADPTGIIAENCTYSYGSWNEYWYCELVKNSGASYTHDYQFGRLDNIDDLSEIKSGDTWLKEGNFALVSDDRKSVECYHIFKDSNGNLYRHFHDVADESNPNIYEDFDLNGDGLLNDLKEDRQRYYLPFGQVFNGLGYGVKPTYTFDGFTLVEDGTVISGEKFNVKGDADLTYRPGEKIYLKDLVELGVDLNLSKLSQSSLYVSASPIGDGATVSITYSRDVENWENNYFVISEDAKGAFKLVITDYFYCTPTVIVFNVETAAQKFEAKNVADMGAYTQITLGDLFIGANIDDDVTATILVDGVEFATIDATASDWETKSLILTKDGKYTVTIKENDDYCQATQVEFTVNKIDKFTANNVGAQNAYTQLTLSQLFAAKVDANIIGDVTVTVTNANGTFTITATAADWATKTIDLTKEGSWTVTIVDNAACNEASVTFDVTVAKKFEVKFEGDFLYRVGNANTVALGSLFKDLSAAIAPSNLKIEIAKAKNNGAEIGNVTWILNNADKDWTKQTIDFDGTGVVVITVSADGAESVTLTLEVVNATNVVENGTIGNYNTTSVLLGNTTVSTLYLNGGATLYGNGFTIDCTNSPTSGTGNVSENYIIGLAGANLDNVKVIGKVYTEYGAMASSNYNRALIISTGNSTITNCYLSNTAAPVRINSGSLTITGSTLKGGNFANIDVRSGHLILDNVTTINQALGNDKAEDGSTVIGLGIVVYYEMVNTSATSITVKNGFKQYNHISSNDKFSNDYANQFVTGMFDSSNSSLQYTNGSTKWVNTGIILMTGGVSVTGAGNKSDVRFMGATGAVYTTIPTAASVEEKPAEYATLGQGVLIPSASFDHDNEVKGNYIPKEADKNDYCYFDGEKILISMDQGDTFQYDPFILNATKLGNALNYTVKLNGNPVASGSKISFNVAGEYTITYTYEDSYNYRLGSDGKLESFTVTYTKTEIVSVAIVEKAAEHAKFTFATNSTGTEEILYDNNTYISANGVTVDGTNWGQITVGDKTINYPIVTANVNKTASSECQVFYYVLNKVISITDANGTVYSHENGTGTDGTMPSNLKVVKGNELKVENNVFTSYNDSNLARTGGKIFCYSSSSQEDAPVKFNNALAYQSPSGLAYSTKATSSAPNGTRNYDAAVIVQYQFTDSNGATYYYYVGYKITNPNKECPSGDGIDDSGCVTEGTLITMADGTQKRVEDLVVGDMILAFNHVTGKVEAAPLIFNTHIDETEAEEQEVLHLQFSDGREVKIVQSHGFFDTTLMRYVYIDYDNYQDYIGHEFYAMNADGTSGERITLTEAFVVRETVRIFCPVTYFHMNSFANGLLNTPNIPGDITGLVNYFEYDEDLKYNEEAMQRDIETYGLYTYDDFKEYISEAAYLSSPAVYLKVAVGKGMITYEQIIDVINYLLAGSLIQ